MLRFSRRVSAVLLALTLVVASPAVCAGWMPTPEARMACCANGETCPMHKSDSHGDHSQRTVTQAEADSCCASSDRDNSNPSSPTFVTAISAAVLGPGIVLPTSVPALVLSDNWRTASPVHTTLVPRHVLLSVFLV